MRISHTEIIGALSAALERRGLSADSLHLMPIDPPRPWGAASNACFMLGKQAAAADIERATAGLDKKAAKALASELAKAAGEQLAREIAQQLNELCDPGGTGRCAGGDAAGAGLCPGPEPGAQASLPVINGGQRRPPSGNTGLPFIAKVEAEGAYINFYYDIPAVVGHVVASAAGSANPCEPGGQASLPAGAANEDTPAGTQALRGTRALRQFGHGAATGRRIMVEYAQPNTHKDFHVGHLRNASIGQAIANLLEFAGNDVLKATYIGDVGLHIAKALYGQELYEKYHPKSFMDVPDEATDPVGYWGAIYKHTNKLLADLKAANEQSSTAIPAVSLEDHSISQIQTVREFIDEQGPSATNYTFAFNTIKRILRDIEQAIIESRNRTPEEIVSVYPIYRKWDTTSNQCVNGFNTIFDELDIRFDPDYYFRESTVDRTGLGKATAAELKALGIAEVDESEEYRGALYVDFAKHVDALKPGAPASLRADIGGQGRPPSGESTGQGAGATNPAGTEARPTNSADAAVRPTEDGGRGGPPHLDSPRQPDTQPEPVFRDDEKKRIRQLGKMTILRSDGTSLYQTKELGLAKHKFDLVAGRFGAPLAESLYVVGAEQKLYFEQVFAILRLWGFPNAERVKHIAYELVVLPEGKMSSREGNIVSYRELRDEAVKRAEEITREKGIGAAGAGGAVDEAKVHDIAKKIAIAAIKYAMLKVTGAQQIVFDFEEALSFNGRTAPYLQYAYARAGKLIGETGAPASPGAPASLRVEDGGQGRPPSGNSAPAYALHESEVELARRISLFPDVCAEAAAKYEPATLCSYLYDLADAFSGFYRDCRVLDAGPAERAFRQQLVTAFRNVVRTGFTLLALPLPEEM